MWLFDRHFKISCLLLLSNASSFLLLVWIEEGTAAASRALALWEQKLQQNQNFLGNSKPCGTNIPQKLVCEGGLHPGQVVILTQCDTERLLVVGGGRSPCREPMHTQGNQNTSTLKTPNLLKLLWFKNMSLGSPTFVCLLLLYISTSKQSRKHWDTPGVRTLLNQQYYYASICLCNSFPSVNPPTH